MDTISLQQICGILANTIGIASYLIYLRGIYRNSEKPHIFSWLLWGLLTLIVWYAQFVKGAGPGAWVTLISALFCFVIAGCSWTRGEKNITRSDWIVFIIGISSIPLWYVTKEPLPSVILLALIDWMSIYPMLRKSFINPQEENISFYVINISKWTLTLFAINQMRIVNWLYPASLLVQHIVIVALLALFRKRKQS